MELKWYVKSLRWLIAFLLVAIPAFADLVVQNLYVTNRSVEQVAGDGYVKGATVDDTNWIETSDNIFIYVRSDAAGVTVKDGTISYAHGNFEFNTNANFGIYSLSGTTATLVADCTGGATSDNTWRNAALDSPVVITPSTTVYLIGCLIDDATTGRLNSNSETGVTAKKVTMTYGNSLAASFDTSSASNVNNGNNELPLIVFDNQSGDPS